MAGQVFMSYAREDENFALKLAGALKKQGVPVWLDQWDIPAGADWDMEVEQALFTSSHLIVVLSPASMSSSEVRNEWRAALDEGKPVIPVLFQVCRIHRQLRLLQHIDFTSKSPTDADAVGQVVAELRRSQEFRKPIRTAREASEPDQLPIEAQAEAASEPAPPAVKEAKEELATSLGQVFISHNAEHDGDFARRLAGDLEALGVRVWIAPESINPGETWTAAIQRGLEESTHVLVVCTPAGMDSSWVELEVDSAIALERQGRLTVVPLDVQSCQVPLFLQSYQKVSFRQNYDTALQRLASRLK